jgi:hypothetical protein
VEIPVNTLPEHVAMKMPSFLRHAAVFAGTTLKICLQKMKFNALLIFGRGGDRRVRSWAAGNFSYISGRLVTTSAFGKTAPICLQIISMT